MDITHIEADNYRAQRELVREAMGEPTRIVVCCTKRIFGIREVTLFAILPRDTGVRVLTAPTNLSPSDVVDRASVDAFDEADFPERVLGDLPHKTPCLVPLDLFCETVYCEDARDQVIAEGFRQGLRSPAALAQGLTPASESLILVQTIGIAYDPAPG